MKGIILKKVWVFSGSGSFFPCGIFSDKDKATEWILKRELTGVLTAYPMDVGVYDWAVGENFFSPKKEHEYTSEFIQRFTSASQEHYHFENGVKD